MNFLVVDVPSSYNGLLGRPGLIALRSVPSPYHLVLKFPTPRGAGECRSDQLLSRKCYSAELTEQSRPGKALPVHIEDLRDDPQQRRGEPAEDLLQVPLDMSNPEQTIQIGSSLKEPQRGDLVNFLRSNADVFAWSAADMPGIPRAVAQHCLNVDPTRRPVRQKKRSFAAPRQQIIDSEVAKLLDAGFIRELHYPEWLANVVIVPKPGDKWRICIDFTDLNKACPKDSFPLPRIDQLIDATAGHAQLSFMDAYSGYNQIRMNAVDAEKTAFVTSKGLFCYTVMPFGLKNAGATYQRLVNKMFADQIGRNMEVYVDDMLVKSLAEVDHIRDLTEAFNVLRQHRMRLNPAKCAFGVTSGKFLGFMVSNRGIEANPAKIAAILDMPAPTKVKEVQELTGRVAALNRFMSRSADKCLPFFQTLKGNKTFQWTAECQQAFHALKAYLHHPPYLSNQRQGTLWSFIWLSPQRRSARC